MSILEKPTGTHSPLNLGSAVMSFFLPGLGQLFQGRGEAFLGHLILYGLAAALPYTGIYSLVVTLLVFYEAEVTLTFLLLPLPLLMLLFSALDAAYWKPGEPSRMYRPIRLYAFVFASLYLVLFTMAIPAVSAAREAARRMQCTGNMKQLALAMHNCHDAYKAFPPAYTVDESGKPLHSWRVLLLPYLNEENLYARIRLDEPWDSDHNSQFHKRIIGTYKCPSNKNSVARAMVGQQFPKLQRNELNCNYSVIIGEQTIFPGLQPVKMSQITDGTSYTILIVERMFPICWMDPTREITFDEACTGINANIYGSGSAHNKGCNVALADGCIHFIPETIEPETLKAMLTKAGGESIALP